ncbi:MAG: hypothetical protein AAB305_06860 [Candidatus Zixiibacteriota bacterium]
MLNLSTPNQTMPKPEMQTTRPSRSIAHLHPSPANEASENFGVGLFFGFAAAVIGASLWALITAITEYQIGWMAIGVGFATGWAVRLGAKVDPHRFRIFRSIEEGNNEVNSSSLRYGIAGACLALVGCMLGNLMTSCYFIAQQYDTTFFRVFFSLNSSVIGEIFIGTFQPMDVLFYGLAIYAGYKYSQEPKGEKRETVS